MPDKSNVEERLARLEAQVEKLIQFLELGGAKNIRVGEAPLPQPKPVIDSGTF